MLKSHVLNQREIIKRELQLYKQSLTNNANLCKVNLYLRETKTFTEYDFNMPQTLFYIYDKYNNIIFGRKTLSQLYLRNQLKSLNCSRITSNMLLGLLSSVDYNDRKITTRYYPLDSNERRDYFDKIVKEKELYNIEYPFQFRFFETNLEQTSDDLIWNVNEEVIKRLSIGESHFREYTKEVILKYGFNPYFIYDPACSTGEFLKFIKSFLNNCKTIGHDLSESMVEYSKRYVDESLCCAANNSPIENESIDLLVLRFLNGGVLSSENAYELFDSLIKKVKQNGNIICFGHTPVLIKKNHFINSNLSMIESIGYEIESNSIFQYYLAKRR